MSNNSNQPRPDDAVLGSQSSSSTGAVLGGLEGVKRRLVSESEEIRIAALKDAFKYGQEGLDQVIQIAKAEHGMVQRVADDLLWESVDEKEKSEVGENYNHLRELLITGKWKEADWETGNKMRKIGGGRVKVVNSSVINPRTKRPFQARWTAYLEPEDIKKFPCKDLCTIDQLWVNYSDGRFGFSVQKRIWIDEGGKPGAYDQESYMRFDKRVGWGYYPHMTFTSNGPMGHLPVGGIKETPPVIHELGPARGLICSPEQVLALVSRLRECDI